MSTPFTDFALLAAGQAALSYGLFPALAEGPGTAAQLAARLQCDPRALSLVLDVLACTTLVERTEDRYSIPVATRDLLDKAPGGTVAVNGLFAHVSTFVKTGAPIERMDGSDTERSDAYQKTVLGLARLFGRSAQHFATQLAPVTGTILDVGAGSGIWSLELLARSPAANLIALDLPPVLALFAQHAAERGLADRTRGIAGSWFDAPIPSCELAILANVLHLEDDDGARRLLHRVAEHAKSIAIIDVLDGDDDDARRVHASYQLHLGARTSRGRAYRRSELGEWLSQIGWRVQSQLPLVGDVGLALLVATSK